MSRKTLFVVVAIFACIFAKAAWDRQSFIMSVNQGIAPDGTLSEQTEWPNLVGLDKDEAVSWLKAHTVEKHIIPVRMDAAVTMDYSTSRIRVFYNPDTKKVSSAPRIG